MKKKKIEPQFIYKGLGFPILLKNVPMVDIRGVKTPDINLNLLQIAVLLALAFSPVALTGNQVRYIRLWLELNQTEFGALLGVTHPAVVKWEKTKNEASKITLTTQRDLKALLLDKLLDRDEDFRTAFRKIHLSKISNKIEPLEFDAQKDLVAG